MKRVVHLAPRGHRKFYNSQRWALNVTRAEMIRAGWSPSVRLFEAAACGVPVISDWWDGLDDFFTAGKEIMIAESSDDVLEMLHDVDDDERRAIGERARLRVLREHTAAHRARQIESIVEEAERKRERGRRHKYRRHPAEEREKAGVHAFAHHL